MPAPPLSAPPPTSTTLNGGSSSSGVGGSSSRPKEVMSIQYYLRNPTAGPQIGPTTTSSTSSKPSALAATTNASSNSNMVSITESNSKMAVHQQQQAAAVEQTIRAARLQTLKEKHPEYNAFMLDMTLYQEDQCNKERNRSLREEVQQKKEKRLAARLKAIDALVSLPQLLDVQSGKPAPVDKKALTWLQQYHPEVASKWTALIGLSHTVNSPRLLSKKYAESEEDVARRIEAVEGSLHNDLAAHEKRKKEADDQTMSRILWFRGDKEKKIKKAESLRVKEAIEAEKAAGQRERHREAVLEQHRVAMEQRSAEAAAKLERTMEVHHERHEVQLRQDEVERLHRMKQLTQDQRDHEAAQLRIAAEEDAERQRRWAARQEKHKALQSEHEKEFAEKREAWIAAQQKRDQAISHVSQERHEVAAYLKRVHSDAERKAAEAAEKSKEQRQKHLAQIANEARHHVEQASARRIKAHDAVRQHPSSSERHERDVSPSSPRYLRPIGYVSETRRHLTEEAFHRSERLGESEREDDDDQDRKEGDKGIEWRLRQGATYEANRNQLLLKERAIAEAAKRRQEYVEAYVHEPAAARTQHAKEVVARHDKEQAESWKTAYRKLEASQEELERRVFVPRPPKLSESEPRQAVPRPPDLRSIQREERQQLSPSPRRQPSPLALQTDRRVAGALQRHAATVEKTSIQIAEQHAAQVAKEEVVQRAREEAMRYTQARTRHHLSTAAEKAERRREDMELSSRRPKTLKHSNNEVVAATARHEAHRTAISLRFSEHVSRRSDAAQKQRMMAMSQKEDVLSRDIEDRQERHAALFTFR